MASGDRFQVAAQPIVAIIDHGDFVEIDQAPKRRMYYRKASVTAFEITERDIDTEKPSWRFLIGGKEYRLDLENNASAKPLIDMFIQPKKN